MDDLVRYHMCRETLFDDFVGQLKNQPNGEVLISGSWCKPMYEEMIQAVLNHASNCSYKVIVPHVRLTGSIPLNLIKKIPDRGGQVRINSGFTNNLLLINDCVFVLSFTSRLGKLNDISTTFECALRVNEAYAVEQIKNTFIAAFLFKGKILGVVFSENYNYRFWEGRL